MVAVYGRCWVIVESMTNKEVPYKAPFFKLKNSLGETVSLDDFAGKWLVLYFYPKDDTPGCTLEACSFRDNVDLKKMGVEVVGISRDDGLSHEKFKSKYELDFTLLSDPEKEVIEAYGAWGKKMFGKEGIQRKTFIIDPDGQVVKVFGRVTPMNHADQVAAAIKLRKTA